MNFIKFDKIVTVNFLDLADNISYVQDHVNSGWIDMISEFLYLGKKKSVDTLHQNSFISRKINSKIIFIDTQATWF